MYIKKQKLYVMRSVLFRLYVINILYKSKKKSISQNAKGSKEIKPYYMDCILYKMYI